MTTTVFLVQRIGPYHHARLDAYARRSSCALVVLEYRPKESVYAWERSSAEARYRRRVLSRGETVGSVLSEVRPDAVVCTGYSDPEIQTAALWALNRGIPAVTCSDSTWHDEPRGWLKESIKRNVVAAFDSALVAGKRAKDYLGGLGIAPEHCFEPWDVVDNEYFRGGADAARARGESLREELGLPARYFLCVSRFVEKKNLPSLVAAYGTYRRGASGAPWSLVLAGSGPLEVDIRDCARACGVADSVTFTGSLGYAELPSRYGLAGAFVLASVSEQWGLVVNEAMASGLPVVVSSRCGCAPDLVSEGGNGYLVDPSDEAALATALGRMASLSTSELRAMGHASYDRILGYGPDSFASGLAKAVDHAAGRSRRRKPGARIALGILARRGARQ